MKISLYEDGCIGRSISIVHSHFHRFSWPIDAYLLQFRAMLHRTPICDFPKNNPLDHTIRKDDIVIECGANIGGLSRYLAQYAKQVYSFEPNPKAFRYLKRNVTKIPNIQVFNKGVSNKTKQMIMNTEWSFSGANSVYKLQNVKYASQQLAHFTSLNDLKKELGVQPSLLILDCEGSEMDVIAGADQVLKGIRQIFCETHPLADGTNTEGPMRELLEQNGYSITTGRDRGYVLWLIGTRLSS